MEVFPIGSRSEEHTSELQSHSFISYAVFCLKKKTIRDAVTILVRTPSHYVFQHATDYLAFTI